MSTDAPAVLGGEPAFSASEIAALWPLSDLEEKEALARVIDSGAWCRLADEHWGHGECGRFEEEFASYLGSPFVLGVMNGTAAIEVALLALGIGPGDEVIVQAGTFFGSVTPILRIGARPVFVDLDPRTWTLDCDAVQAAIGPRTAAVMAVHLLGLPTDLDALRNLCSRRGLVLIEDAAQAAGSRWRGRGLGTIGEAGTFSFQQGKVLQAGEGGAIALADEHVLGRAFAVHQGFGVVGSPSFDRHQLAANMRMSPWQAAVLRCQLRRLEGQLQHRLDQVARLRALLQPDDPVSVVPHHEGLTRWSPFGVPLRFNPDTGGGLSRDAFLAALQAENVPVSEGHYEPLPLRPIFVDNDFDVCDEGCPVTERLAADEAVVLAHPLLLGPRGYMERLVVAMRRIRDAAGVRQTVVV